MTLSKCCNNGVWPMDDNYRCRKCMQECEVYNNPYVDRLEFDLSRERRGHTMLAQSYINVMRENMRLKRKLGIIGPNDGHGYDKRKKKAKIEKEE